MNTLHSDRAQVWTGRHKWIDGNPAHVLVVDDNANAAQALSAFLNFEGIQARAVFGGFEAVDAARTWRPDLIVMDISMPECNGIEATQMLRADARTKTIAIIAFSALDQTEVSRQSMKDDFDGYCQKGQSPTMLTKLIWNFLVREH